MTDNLPALAGIEGEVIEQATAQLLEIPARYDSGERFTTDAKVYRLLPPLEDDGGDQHNYVIVSASNQPGYGIYETYIFPCDATGKITGWGELDGSFQGALDHDRALEGAGYQVVR